eukprot:5254834-Amphidinium_carterae.1
MFTRGEYSRTAKQMPPCSEGIDKAGVLTVELSHLLEGSWGFWFEGLFFLGRLRCSVARRMLWMRAVTKEFTQFIQR